ncbi:hypothetical protein Tco_1143601, partial [Tanacetum coccineum]
VQKKTAAETDLDFSDLIISLENKYQQPNTPAVERDDDEEDGNVVHEGDKKLSLDCEREDDKKPSSDCERENDNKPSLDYERKNMSSDERKLSGGDVFGKKIKSVLRMDEDHDNRLIMDEVKPSGGDEKVELVTKTNENVGVGSMSEKDKLQVDKDLEWDEIGNIGENDEKHVTQGGSLKKDEVPKRLNSEDDDEDLCWDTEDDDDGEPVKTGEHALTPHDAQTAWKAVARSNAYRDKTSYPLSRISQAFRLAAAWSYVVITGICALVCCNKAQAQTGGQNSLYMPVEVRQSFVNQQFVSSDSIKSIAQIHRAVLKHNRDKQMKPFNSCGKWTTFDDVNISNSMKKEQKKTVEHKWTTFDDDDENCHPNLFADRAPVLSGFRSQKDNRSVRASKNRSSTDRLFKNNPLFDYVGLFALVLLYANPLRIEAVQIGCSNENITFKKQCMRSADLSSVSHSDLQEPVSGIGTSKHQVTSNGHIAANHIATNVSENNMSGTILGNRGVAIGTLVIAEHESGSLTSDSLSSVVAASKFLSKDNSLSLLLAGSGPSLQDAATNSASCHLSVSQASSFFREL